MNTGIYLIEHKDSGRVYVGSAVNLGARKRTHFCQLRKGVHHSRHLQAAWDKYGGGAFEFKKLIICKKDDLIFYEQRVLDSYKAADPKYGFNIRPKAESMLGVRHSQDAIAKSKWPLGKPRDAMTRAKISAALKGVKKSPESVAKRTGVTHSAETCRRRSESQKGHVVPAATRAKLRAANLGAVASDETREKMRKAQYERKLTPELAPRMAQAREIRMRHAAGGIKQAALAREFGLSASVVNRIILNKCWTTKE